MDARIPSALRAEEFDGVQACYRAAAILDGVKDTSAAAVALRLRQLAKQITNEQMEYRRKP